MSKQLYTSEEWDADTLQNIWDTIDHIAKTKYKLDYYPVQNEIISEDKLLESLAQMAMPIMYPHWSFGKRYHELKQQYDYDWTNLTHEVIINSNPAIAYLVDTNDTTLMTLVMCHASVGHNTCFKNNYMLRTFANAENIIPYLQYSKDYIEECEIKYGAKQVEQLIDLAHELQYQSIDKYVRKKPTKMKHQKYNKDRVKHAESNYDDVKDLLLSKKKDKRKRNRYTYKLPEENLLYFAEKNALYLEDWQREVLRIVRQVAQYFYPQIMTKLINEGIATAWHYTLLNDLVDEGYITDGQYIRAMTDHCRILNTPPFPTFQVNPYTIGHHILQDVKRICLDPDEEDKRWFPDLIGCDWVDVYKDITENYRDSSFIANFLGPKVIRKEKLFSIKFEENNEYTTNVGVFFDGGLVQARVTDVHDDVGMKQLRIALSKQYEWDYRFPEIKVVYFSPEEDKVVLQCDRKVDKHTIHILIRYANLLGIDSDINIIEEEK